MHSETGGLANNKAINEDIKQIGIVFFCGIGGETQSGKNARLNGKNCIKVFYALNHDPAAIETHKANHDDVHTAVEDIWHGNIEEIKNLLTFWKSIYPSALVFIQYSTECTNYSDAKGGQSRDADSRMLPNSIFRYIDAINPDIIYIENVEEFMSWGPLKIKVKKRHSNFTELKTRFDKKSNQEQYCFEPYSRKNGILYQEWKSNIIDYGYNFDYRMLNSADFGGYTSRERYFAIFAKPGIPIVFPTATHARTASNKDLFGKSLDKWKSVKDILDLNDHGYSIFYKKNNLDIPARFRRNTCDKSFKRYYDALVKHVAGGKNKFAERKQFLTIYHGSGPQSYSLDRPSTTIPTKDSLSLITPIFWIDKQYSGKWNHQSINDPAGSIMTVDKHKLMTCEQIVYNPAWGGHSISVDRPMVTIVARQDKAPVSVITILYGENVAIPVYADDSEIVIKIKEFMVCYNIVDIKMRMLMVRELKLIMGFPSEYVLKGSVEQQKKGIGNAVEVVVGTAVFETMAQFQDNGRIAA